MFTLEADQWRSATTADRFSLPDNVDPQWRESLLPIVQRYVAPAFCIVLPLFFFIGILQPIVAGAVLGGDPGSAAILKISPSSIISKACLADVHDENRERTLSDDDVSTLVTSHDLAGRYLFSIPSAILRLMSILAIAFSFVIISHRTSSQRAFLIVSLGVAIGFLVTFTVRPAPIDARNVLIFPIMDALAEAKANAPFLSDIPREIFNRIIAWNLSASVISMGAVLIGFAAISMGATEAELTTRRLKARLYDLQRFTIVMAIIPILTVVTTKAMIGWQLGFLCEAPREALGPLGAALGNYWGAASTGVILAALLPAYFGWREDVERFSLRQMHEKSEKERREFLSDEGLEFAPSSSIPTILAVAAPAASGPFLDLIGPAFF